MVDMKGEIDPNIDYRFARYKLPDSALPITESWWPHVTDEGLEESLAATHARITVPGTDELLHHLPLTDEEKAFWRSIGSPALNEILSI